MNRTSTTTRTENRGGKTGHAPRDHYQEVTDRIIAALEAGTPPWRKPWDPDKAGGPAMPRNAATGQRYRGINVLTLGMSPLAFEQRRSALGDLQAGGRARLAGAQGRARHDRVFLQAARTARRQSKPDDDEDAVRRIPLLRAFTLFHASQIDGISALRPAYDRGSAVARAGGRRDHSRQQRRCRQDRRRPRVLFAFDGSHPDAAAIGLRHGEKDIAGPLLHEPCHWTGAPTRLNRDLRNRFGSHDYAREEFAPRSECHALR